MTEIQKWVQSGLDDAEVRKAIERFARESPPVASAVAPVRHVALVAGKQIEFDRITFMVPEGLDAEEFAYGFYASEVQGDRFAYSELAMPEVRQKVALGMVPIRLDVWGRRGRKSRPAKPVRMDVWFAVKRDDPVKQAARRYYRPGELVGGRYG